MLLVGSTQDLTFIGPGGTHQPFVVHTGDHVVIPSVPSVAIFGSHLRIEGLNARRQNDRPYLDFYLLRRLTKIDRLILTDTFANTAFLLFQVNTAFVDIRDEGNGLSEVDMDGLILRYLLIELIRVFDRAVFDAGRTARALVL
jgi:hypothetical protein